MRRILHIALVAGQAAHAAPDARCRPGYDARAPRCHKGLRKGRPPIVDKGSYAERNAIERLIGRLQGCRWLATRYETCARCCLAGGIIRRCFRKLGVSDTA